MPDADVNSLVTYIYRDAGNYKFRASIVVGGTLKLQELTPHLFDGEFFIPARIGLRRLVPSCMNEDDHELHAFDAIEPIRGGDVICPAGEFVERFAAANKAGWF